MNSTNSWSFPAAIDLALVNCAEAGAVYVPSVLLGVVCFVLLKSKLSIPKVLKLMKHGAKLLERAE
ncbi:MAG: hypothetical protein IJG39_03565, partial [Synergistaceae bacterium]|nr:hypothetical protein [Synergistaceae bacterium]